METNNDIISTLLLLDEATCYMSYHDTQHPLFQKLLSFGPDAIEPLLQHLRDDKDPRDAHNLPRGCWWVVIALSYLTLASPIKLEHCGRIDGIISDWLEWAENNDY